MIIKYTMPSMGMISTVNRRGLLALWCEARVALADWLTGRAPASLSLSLWASYALDDQVNLTTTPSSHGSKLFLSIFFKLAELTTGIDLAAHLDHPELTSAELARVLVAPVLIFLSSRPGLLACQARARATYTDREYVPLLASHNLATTKVRAVLYCTCMRSDAN